MIAIAPIAEQREVARIVAKWLYNIESLLNRLELAQSGIPRLEQSVLAKAFSGELVPQDPADEPASVLLERIRAVRADGPENPRWGRALRPADAPTSARKSNGHRITSSRDDSIDLVVAALQADAPHLTTAAIAAATNLDAPAVKQAIKTLVAAGQVRVHGKARGTSYEWIA